MSNGGKLEMDSGQSNDITRCILARGLFPSSLVLVIRSVMENRIGGVTNGWIICVGGGGQIEGVSCDANNSEILSDE